MQFGDSNLQQQRKRRRKTLFVPYKTRQAMKYDYYHQFEIIIHERDDFSNPFYTAKLYLTFLSCYFWFWFCQLHSSSLSDVRPNTFKVKLRQKLFPHASSSPRS